MTATQAKIGYGSLFKVLIDGDYVTIGQQASVSPPKIAVDSVDASHEESPDGWREFIPGLKDGGETSSDLIYVPGGETEAMIYSMLGTVQTCRNVFPNGAHADYSAFITGFEPDTPIDDKMVATMTWKLSGEITVTPAAAPTNRVVPAISGTAQVGVTLTAFRGLWNNEPTSFAYAWKKGGVAINGATAKTYVPVLGDVDSDITVTVTGSNSAGTASATSAATPDVIAA